MKHKTNRNYKWRIRIKLHLIVIIFCFPYLSYSQNNKDISRNEKGKHVFGSDDTKYIQNLINKAEEEGGGIVAIPNNARFKLKDLRLGNKVNLSYSKSSDISSDAGHTKNSGEWYHFLSGANTNGVVNEFVIASPFHPGLIIDVRKDLNGQNHLLGRDQQLNNPSRESLIFRDEGINQVVFQYKNFRENTKFSGFNLFNFRNVYNLYGVGSASFIKSIKKGDIVNNSKKDGFGIILEFGPNSMEVLWTSGIFRKGDQIEVLGQLSRSKVEKAEFKQFTTNSIGLNRENGYTSIGLPNNNAVFPLSVGGAIGIQGSRTFGQYLPEFYTFPSLILGDSFEKTEYKGFRVSGVTYYNGIRPVLQDPSGAKNLGHLGAVSAHLSFDNKLNISSSSFNVKKVIELKKGRYKIEFETTFERGDFQVALSTNSPLDYAYVYQKHKDFIVVSIVKTGTTQEKIPESAISVICIGAGY